MSEPDVLVVNGVRVRDCGDQPGMAVAHAATLAFEHAYASGPPNHFPLLYSSLSRRIPATDLAIRLAGNRFPLLYSSHRRPDWPIDILCGNSGPIGRFKMRDAIR